jgi:hypothetical protein
MRLASFGQVALLKREGKNEDEKEKEKGVGSVQNLQQVVDQLRQQAEKREGQRTISGLVRSNPP